MWEGEPSEIAREFHAGMGGQLCQQRQQKAARPAKATKGSKAAKAKPARVWSPAKDVHIYECIQNCNMCFNEIHSIHSVKHTLYIHCIYVSSGKFGLT